MLTWCVSHMGKGRRAMWARVSLLLNFIKRFNSILLLLIKNIKQCLTVYSPHEPPNPVQAGATQLARDA
jgi:hypothetical protein